MRALPAALFFTLSAAEGLAPFAHAGALRDAALAVMTVRENPGELGRRAALDVAFDASHATVGAEEGVPEFASGRRKNWFHRKPGSLPREEGRLRVPELAAAPRPTGFAERAAAALGAALAPWRSLADAAWGGAWTGMVMVGRAESRH